MSSSVRVVVLGYIVRGPLAGFAWHHAQYVLGLHNLGHEVLFIEDSQDYAACYNPDEDSMGKDPTYGLKFTGRLFTRLGLGEQWAYWNAHESSWLGAARGRAAEFCETADLLIHLSGKSPVRPWLEAIPCKALVDTDPCFTQIRHLKDTDSRAKAVLHDVFFTFGENFGAEACSIPEDGLPWQATRQPIVLEAWPVTVGPRDARFTTVMQWDSYQTELHAGRRYGMKSDSFDPFFDLPSRVSAELELAVGSPTAPRKRLRDRGWRVRDPRTPTRDPWVYQEYIRRSKAEFSVAKHGYVVSQSGWFSERSAAYLASGRPVVVQDTGFQDWLHADAGVVPFKDREEAVAAIEDVQAHYGRHCQAARDVAASWFDSRKVLQDLVERCASAV